MSQRFIIDRLDKQKLFPKPGVGKISSDNHILYHGDFEKSGFTLSDPSGQQPSITYERDGSWWDVFLGRGDEVFVKDRSELCRIKYSLRKFRGELIINNRPYSLKPICKINSIFKPRTWKYNWESCSLDLDYDGGMCVARLEIEENLDHLPFIAVAYYLWMRKDNRD